MYTMPNRKAIAYPGLNAGAGAHHGVNARHEFGISPANCAGAPGSPVGARQAAPARLGPSEKMKETQ